MNVYKKHTELLLTKYKILFTSHKNTYTSEDDSNKIIFYIHTSIHPVSKECSPMSMQ